MKPPTPNQNVAILLEERSHIHPNRILFAEKNKRVTFGAFWHEVRQTASYFQSRGIAKGDRVLVFVPMSTDLYRGVLALMLLGAVPVFLDEWVSLKRLKVCCEHVGCKGLLAPFRFQLPGYGISFIRKIPVKLYSGLKHSSETHLPECSYVNENDTGLITFTTGSTGIPKAANRTHGFLRRQLTALKSYMSEDPAVVMTMLPIVSLLNMALGKTTVLADFKARKPAAFRPDLIANIIIKEEVTSLIASPFFIHQLALYRQKTGVHLPLKELISGGAPVFPEVASMIDRQFPHTRFLVLYGSTEAEPVAHCKGQDIIDHQHAFGLWAGHIHTDANIHIIPHLTPPLPHTTEHTLKTLALPHNKVGEIIVSGPHVLTGYIDHPEAEAACKIKTEQQVWHRTGDLGYMNNEQMLFLLGRHEIRKGEHRLYPFDIERKLLDKEGHIQGTIVEWKGLWVLIICHFTPPHHMDWNTYLGFEPDKVVNVKSIPKDPRHHSKIHYPQLIQILESLED
jgi:olefin beta-lactone synthetase